MQVKSFFSVESARSSVIDLAAKCKHLSQLRRELRDRRQSGEEKPTVTWDKGTPDEHQLNIFDVIAKRETRGDCSRVHQLAYAWLRGMPYRAVEATTREPFPVFSILFALEDHLTPEGRESLPVMEARKPGLIGKVLGRQPEPSLVKQWSGSPLFQMTHDALTAWSKEDPAHLRCMRWDAALRKLIARGLGESEEADKIRDDMLDECWKQMTPEQIEWVKRRVARIARREDARKANLLKKAETIPEPARAKFLARYGLVEGVAACFDTPFYSNPEVAA